MGISAGGDKSGLKNDINVTPLVDIILVLLIIFLVTMPIVMRQITIEVPRKLEADEVVVTGSRPITVTVKADGNITVNDGAADKEVPRVELAATLAPLLAKRKTEKVVFVDFEEEVYYGEAVSAMDTIKGLGTEEDPVKVALKLKETKAPGAE
jgi:biopolymer transport protein ExbD